ncbi:MAG: NAD(P)-dependent oxidoreductase [Kiritimatiellae bacterium]|nr:NAD(P)-dependent oxidoreductase [Kiritimatiellia bacterium]MDD5519790.1 NAD(P)-dependent oxidoreductase [Kiritimatiellia bacterium]
MFETVLVTEPEFNKAEDIFRNVSDMNCEPVPVEEKTLADMAVTYNSRTVIVGVTPYRGPLYEALGKAGGALIARFGVGHDNIDKILARQHNIIITNTPGVLDISVAEHTVWLMGCLSRHIARLDARFRTGQFITQTGMELRGKTLGILGFGNIGRRVAAMAHFGFGMRVIAADSRPLSAVLAASEKNEAEFLTKNGLDLYTDNVKQVFHQSDILSIHLPSNANTRRFVDTTKLSWLKPNAMLVNTARGEILDEEALYDALSSCQLAGAALDVFTVEPYKPVSPEKDLRRLDNIVLTPHSGSNTQEANARMATACLNNVRHFFAGRLEQLTRVNLTTI